VKVNGLSHGLVNVSVPVLVTEVAVA